MNNGYILAVLGVLGIIVGGAMYMVDYHRTIGLGGVGLGALFILGGLWMSRSAKKPMAQQAAPAAPN